jgi:hypothetical protein
VNVKRKPTSVEDMSIEELEAFISEYNAKLSSTGTSEAQESSNQPT